MIPLRDDIPSRAFPVGTVLIILVNLLVFLYESTLTPEQLEDVVTLYGLVPSQLAGLTGQPVGAVAVTAKNSLTSMFLHGGWLHLIGNMWFLWIFGDNVEDRMGHFRFLLFYLTCGVLAGVVHLAFNWGSPIPSVGASGAVAGVLGAYLVSYPFARILTLIPLFLVWPVARLPALVVLGAWFILQLVSGGAALGEASTAGGVAWWAHIGGFLAGLTLVGAFAKPLLRRYSWEV